MLRIRNVSPLVVAGLLLCSGCACPQFAVRDRVIDSSVASNDGKAVFRANNGGGFGHTDVDCCDEGCDKCDSQIEFGRPHAVIDGVGWIFGIPSKVLLWDRRAENHHVSSETAGVVRQYLRSNNLRDVKVRVNQYAPGDEWRRLTQNKSVSPLWRYSVGALSAVGYTIVPGRLFGRDNYNPFTNTISIYSDIPSFAVHEAAYARDNANHHYRGTYGFGQLLAGVNIWHETQATKLAHNWIQSSQSSPLIAESNRILPPLYGMRVGGSLGELVPPGNAMLTVAGAVAGHAVGMNMNRREGVRVGDANSSGNVINVSHSTAEAASN